MANCFFCIIPVGDKERIIHENNFAFAIYDEFPVSPFHCLVVSKRHVESFFDLSDIEILEIFSLLKECQQSCLTQDGTIVGFNVGVNIGSAAGQSIFHLHVHLIPRRFGDIKEPRGGVRGVIPNKRNYYL